MTEKRNWDQFALLLIDVQRDFWSERLAASFPEFPGNVERLLTFCRGEGIEVVHVRAHFAPDMSDWMVRYRLQGRIPCVLGTEGVEVLSCAAELPGESVFIKQTFDACLDPGLVDYLRSRGKRFLLTAGLVTSVCVFLTTASAAQQGFLTAMVEDCSADEPSAHQSTLERYQFIFYRATVAALEDEYPRWSAMLEQLGDTAS